MAFTFEELWDKFPSEPTLHINPENGKPIFDNYCAINASEALHNVGVKLNGFHGTKCWSCPKGRIHIIRAQQMANWLKTQPFPELGQMIALDPKNYEDNDQTGIIFFKDYWFREGAKSRTGDHIDLWNGSRLTTLFSWFRAQWGLSWDGVYSDFQLSKEILFWPIK